MKLRTLESLIPFPEPSPDPLVIQLAEENAHMLKRMEDISQNCVHYRFPCKQQKQVKDTIINRCAGTPARNRLKERKQT